MKTELLIQMDGVRGVKANEQVCTIRLFGPCLHCCSLLLHFSQLLLMRNRNHSCI